jgi:hypothetical protein
MAHRPGLSERSGSPGVVGDAEDAGGAGADDRGAAAGGGSGDAGNAFIYGLLHRRLWIEALAPLAGVALTPVEELRARDSNDHDWMYEAVLAQLRNVIVPRTDDALAKARGKGIARLVKYLSRLDVYGSYYESCELADLRSLLHAPVDSVAAGRSAAAGAVKEGAVTDEDYLAVLWRRIARETELARPAMGVLADRHWPELR